MRILIIGSQGFIGSNAVNSFVKEGHEVWGCGVSESPMINYFKVNRSCPDYNEIFKHNKFDTCINASGSSGVGFSFENPDLDFQMNVANVHALLNAIRLFNPVCKFINLSSASVYGDPAALPIKEEMQLQPVSPYGYHKMITEQLIKEFVIFFNLPAVTVRIFSAYGPGIKKQLFWDIYQKMKHCTSVELFGSGKETRDFIFIDDLLMALDLIINKSPFKGEIYNLANGHQITIEEAASTFIKLYNENINLGFSGQHKIGDPDCWEADISKIEALGYKKQVELKSGLKKYLEWLTQNEKG